VSVVGFDDSPLARRLRPALTTVHQDFDAKGKAAAHALTSAIARSRKGTPPEAEQHRVLVDLVVRDSTGAPPVG
jgi:DNA-binding LacI/PurR family transcriptional regulator